MICNAMRVNANATENMSDWYETLCFKILFVSTKAEREVSYDDRKKLQTLYIL